MTEPPSTPDPAPPAPDTPTKASAELRIVSAKRRGFRLYVRGRVAKQARGKVSATWSARTGRRRLQSNDTARVRNGRFRLLLWLPARWRSTRAGRLTLVYGGDRRHASAKTRTRVRLSR